MRVLKLFTLTGCLLAAHVFAADNAEQSSIRETVDKAIRPVMQTYNIPGMAIAITIDGKRHFFHYGVASRENRHPVTSETLFEIGSISKTFTATLAAYAQVSGKLSLSDSVSKYLPSLQGSSFDNITLLDLGTHASGGLPLQVPDNINTADQLIAYLKDWQPQYAAGTHRTYSNVSIGLLGMITAKAMQASFEDAIEKKLFPALGMKNSYINVPASRMKDYAQGYTRKDVPARMSPGILAAEAYAVKAGTADMIRFIEANMQVAGLDRNLHRAIADTRKRYFRSGEMIQGLIWEQYPFPVELKRVLAGSSDAMTFQTNVATRLSPPLPPQPDALINKTGSTNGFAAYVAFVPAKKTGIVMLANKNYPVDARVAAAYEILTALDSQIGTASSGPGPHGNIRISNSR